MADFMSHVAVPDRHRRGGACSAAGPRQHDARRFGQHLAKADAVRVLLQFIAIIVIMCTLWVMSSEPNNRAMVKLNKIYTRTGDDGTTGLGTRRAAQEIRSCASRPTAPSMRSMPRSVWCGCTLAGRAVRSMPRCRDPERSVRRRRRFVHARQGQRSGRRAAYGHAGAGRVARRAKSTGSTPSLRR